MLRRIAAVIAATALLLVLALPAMAGGWAEIEADAQTKTPTEDTPFEVGFTVLQHGQTPAPWESATVHFIDAGTGEAFDVVATNDRADGHFVATATVPHAGYWSWQVRLADLESQHVPVRMTVLTASGATPPFDPSTVLSAVDTAKTDALAARVDALEGVGGLPLLAVISLSVLAGSAAGFAMAWLAGRKPPREIPPVALNPAQRGAGPV